MADQQHIVLETRMSDYGYWVVTLGVAPAKRVSIMVCKVGITPCEARELALTGVSHVLKRNGDQ